ncbi:MAG: SMI1/KNR4 family protein [Polyangiales bacterium]
MAVTSKLDLPLRLRGLAESSAYSSHRLFADWQFERAAPIAKLYPPDLEELVDALGERLVIIAGDVGGGVLALDLARAESIEHAQVVEFDSEGGITVVGTSFDDFLALVSSDAEDVASQAWAAEGAVREWIVASGIRPHAADGGRLAELGRVMLAYPAVSNALATPAPLARLIRGISRSGCRCS